MLRVLYAVMSARHCVNSALVCDAYAVDVGLGFSYVVGDYCAGDVGDEAAVWCLWYLGWWCLLALTYQDLDETIAAVAKVAKTL